MSDLSNKVLDMSKSYLGPAAESFLSRQCRGHLKIELTALTSANLKELATWVEVGAGLVMDQAKAVELAKKIAAV
jgi:hypothetical protein